MGNLPAYSTTLFCHCTLGEGLLWGSPAHDARDPLTDACVFVLSGAIFGIAYLFVKALRPLPASTLLGIGLCWLTLNLLFEFGFFHYAMHEPWEKLWTDYNILRGRLLIVVWLTTLFSPLICGKLTRRQPLPAAVHVLKACGLYGMLPPRGPTEVEDAVLAEQERQGERRRQALFAASF